MPFKSEAQRGWMWVHKPRMAKRWEKHTPDDKKLPYKVKDKKKKTAALERLHNSTVFNELKKTAFKYAELMDPSSMMAASENAERRKEDIHQLDLSFEERKKELELQKMELDIERNRIEFALKMQELQQKAQDQAMQRQQNMLSSVQKGQEVQQNQTDMGLLSQSGIGDVDYKTNLSQLGVKAAAYEDQYIHGYSEKVPFKGKVKPLLLGGALGALGAQLFPTAKTKDFLSQAAKLPTSDPLRNVLRAKGFGANIKRTGLGAGAGLLAGLLAHEMLD